MPATTLTTGPIQAIMPAESTQPGRPSPCPGIRKQDDACRAPQQGTPHASEFRARLPVLLTGLAVRFRCGSLLGGNGARGRDLEQDQWVARETLLAVDHSRQRREVGGEQVIFLGTHQHVGRWSLWE